MSNRNMIPLEDGRTREPALGVGYYGHLDPEPPLLLVYLVVFLVLAAVGVVAWFGWL